MSFGVSLKRERELRGISLDEISRTTKISVRLLEAIEKDRFDVLPEGVFRKSFIKSYAKYLGMNEEQILHEYDLEVKPSTTSQQTPEKPSVSLRGSSEESRRVVLLTLGILLLLLAAGFGFWYLTRASREEIEPPAGQTASTAQAPSVQPRSETISPGALAPTPIPAEAAVPPPSTTGAAEQAAGTVSDPSALKVLGELAKKPEPAPPAGTEGSVPSELTVEASSPAWVSVSSGESTLFSGLLSPGESKKFSLESPLKVTLGNAGGVRLQVDGQVFASLGKAGELKTLEISAANYQQYLTPKTP